MSISEFYNGKTVFVTGGTGFIGKVLLEKLLRSCPGVAHIYVLIRTKKGQQVHERLQQLLASRLFDVVRQKNPATLVKLLPIEGDITQPELGINQSDRELLSKTVNIVFHSAATVRFDEKLKSAVTINMLATQRLVELCRKMTELEALVHVSTAYCHCDRSNVEEVIYEPPMKPEHLISLVNCLDEGLVDLLTPQLIGERPNTYTFTKALAECWLRDNKGDLPLVIVRPTQVLSVYRKPFEGWIDNWNGLTAYFAAAGKGFYRSFLSDVNSIIDIIPVDLVINLLIAAAWKEATLKPKELTIYNCSSGINNPITVGKLTWTSIECMRKNPFPDVAWYPDAIVTKSRALYNLNHYIIHLLPAYIIDCFRWSMGKSPRMVKLHKKLKKAVVHFEYFTTHEWKFHDTNVQYLNACLGEENKKDFNFDVTEIDWDQYIENNILGIRRYLFNEDENSISKSHLQSRISRLYWIYRSLQVLSVMFFWYLLTLRYASLGKFWSYAQQKLIQLAKIMPLLIDQGRRFICDIWEPEDFKLYS